MPALGWQLSGLPLLSLHLGGRLHWARAKRALFCWFCSAAQEECVCGLLASETLGIFLLLSFSVTELQQFFCCPGQACLNLHKRKLTLRF